MSKIAVTRVKVTSLAKLVGVWYGILGLATGIVTAISLGVHLSNTGASELGGSVFFSAIAVTGVLVVTPLLTYAIGWIHGAILAFIVNVVIATGGGLEIETENVK